MERRDRAVEALAGWGAGTVAHPGGTLLDHLRRTEELLRSWGAGDDLALAGLCHAAYGTDGFDVALLPLDERRVLADLIGEGAEALVYRYASCDRAVVNPQLGAEVVRFRDRFDDRVVELAAAELADLVELTFANEIDIVRHNPDVVLSEGSSLVELFRRCRSSVSERAWAAFEDALQPAAPSVTSADRAAGGRHRLAVYLVLRRDDAVLFLRRSGTGYRDGELGLPSGKVELGELLAEAVRREAAEELAVQVAAEHVRVCHIAERRTSTGDWLDVFFDCEAWVGEPVNAEPHKCSELTWLAPDAEGVIDYIAEVLRGVDAGVAFSFHDGD